MSALDDVCERVRERVGTVSRESLGRISATEFQRFAVAAGETDPVYFDDDAARAAGYPGAIAPPLFLSSVLGWGAGDSDADLRPDGAATGDAAGLPLGGLRLMGAGQDIEVHAPVHDGVRLVRETSVEDVTLKEGRSGPFLIVTILREFRDESGTPLLTSRENFIARPEAGT
ncbi:MaoC family dehydratase N-terminal domain-containing protein [Actinomadura syzygii]|uniref:MaoC family dehydratase n=1 Tax=Actinomadura syzygii TaxID=1427538 RepID=A0A5D0UCN2_9ACTN|nr:MaoC family dehydratase N-terminal domain-containing protein [Actinomadura syzygii]TYC15375.1 MaoC family dehydratase [Actinomadura syzygii]